jgi:1-acyl-sn-glycerol-3-phosphate acyltransferase
MSEAGPVSAPAPFDAFPGSDFESSEHRNLAALRLLDSMFMYSRHTAALCSLKNFLLLMYYPIGVLIAVLRIFICLPIMCLVSLCRCTPFCLPRSVHTIILRWEVFLLFGVYIRVKGEPSADARIWVCNHISEFDAVVIRCLTDPYIFAYSIYEKMWWLKCTPIHIFQIVYVPPTSRTEGNAEGRDLVNKKISELLTMTTGTILVFPEGGLTNTPTGLLQYHKHMFGLGVTMQPVALTAWSPLPIALDHSYASFVGNFFYFLFTPFQTYTVEFLSPIATGDAESSVIYARQAMSDTAKNLAMLSSPFLYSDKKKWLQLKRKMHEEGFDFDFTVDEESQTVQIWNTRDVKKTNKIVPLDNNSHKETLIKYMQEKWKISDDDFAHIIFSASGAPSPPPVVSTATPY